MTPLIKLTFLINYFMNSFSEKSKYNIAIEMGSTDQFRDLYCHELGVQVLLKEINLGKSTGPGGIHRTALKNCDVSLAKPLTMM